MIYKAIIIGHLILVCFAFIGLIAALCFAHFLKAFGCLIAIWFLCKIKISKESPNER